MSSTSKSGKTYKFHPRRKWVVAVGNVALQVLITRRWYQYMKLSTLPLQPIRPTVDDFAINGTTQHQIPNRETITFNSGNDTHQKRKDVHPST
jgi:hypothetical protein